MTVYSAILSVSPLSYFILGSEYLALENENDIRNIDNGTIVTYLGEEWIAKRLADLNDPESLWIGWGVKENIASELCIMNVNYNDVEGTFTRTTGSFIDDGFLVGQDVTFSGFESEGNNVTKVIKDITNTIITVNSPTLLVEELGGGGQQAISYISKRDGALFSEVDVRTKCVLTYEEGVGDNAFYKAVGVLTSPGTRIIKEIGIFDAETDGNLLAHSVFDDEYTLNEGDSVTFTLALNPE